LKWCRTDHSQHRNPISGRLCRWNSAYIGTAISPKWCVVEKVVFKEILGSVYRPTSYTMRDTSSPWPSNRYFQILARSLDPIERDLRRVTTKISATVVVRPTKPNAMVYVLGCDGNTFSYHLFWASIEHWGCLPNNIRYSSLRIRGLDFE
jgi:hypothetical protein